MDFRDLEVFVAVARHESFSRAATQLRIAQSALSRRVDRLEHRLGAKLLTRHGRGVRLTDAGQILLQQSEALMRDLAAVEADVQSLSKEPTGHVRVALPPATSEVLSPPLVMALSERFPRISLHIREGFSGIIHSWVLAGEVDIAIFYSPEITPELEVVPLIDEPLCVILPASMPVENDLVFPARNLAGLSLILPARPHSLRPVVERYAADHGVSLRINYEVDGIRTSRAMVAAGLGCTIFSHAEIVGDIEAGRVKAIPLEPRASWRLSMVRRKSARASSAMQEVKKAILEQVTVMQERGFWRGALLTPAPPASRGGAPERPSRSAP